MYTLFLRYTLDPNKLADWKSYAEAEIGPIAEAGGKNINYFAPTDFAGDTAEAIATIDVGTMAEYEIYRRKLAADPKHKEYAAKLQASGVIRSVYRAILQRVQPADENN
ncbi:MAG TPA: NIPSNAP family protein [Acidobacteriaceae bacterium]|nr:NIPSNAP family protein [Acidobacteriaceae bacterium]